ncbi:MAG: 16S rRNA (cytosine(1402)-N(4))-methyltransferase RsmH [Firmicutes bacterium]|nr:16S rRNA (cytosine(1402)-N(4))-methyltransferase RsmH [Bacillota bacterium]
MSTEYSHVPVLYDECMENLNIKPDGIYVDGTLGGGGHAFGIGQRLSEKGLLIGIDRDQDALDAAGKKLESLKCRKLLIRSTYAEIKDVLAREDVRNVIGENGIDGALLDIGVSSFQLDNSERGFSYMQDAPLDMRMNRDDYLTAEAVVNGYSKKELTDIIRNYGEERWASRIAEFIVKARKEQKIETTGQLVDIIKAAIPASARREGPHPAKRTFQAIRIEVNGELEQIEKAVDEFCDVLNPGGRLCIITFHSLEDRIVKQAFQRRLNPCTCPPEFPVCVCGKVTDAVKVTGKPITAGEEELERNPRARSAKLRVIGKK